MDLEKLSKGEKISGISAILLFIFMFLDWFTVDVSGGEGAFNVSASEGGSAWDALDNIPIFLVITIIAVLAVVAIRLTDSTFEPPVSANAVVTVLGAISVLLILYRIIDTPAVGSFPGISIDVSPAYGIFLGLIAAAGITFGGYKSMTEEGVAFSDLGSGGPPPPGPPSGGTPPPAPGPEATPPPPASPPPPAPTSAPPTERPPPPSA